jgi:hypothetical protein
VIFSTILSEIFLIVRRTERDININVYRSSCKIPVTFSHFNGTCTFSTGFEEFQISNYIKILPVEVEFHTGARTDGQTGRHTDMMNIIVAFHYFEKASKPDFIGKQLVRGWCLIKAFIFGKLISV